MCVYVSVCGCVGKQVASCRCSLDRVPPASCPPPEYSNTHTHTDTTQFHELINKHTLQRHIDKNTRRKENMEVEHVPLALSP